jgi:hypothetical protein
MCNSDSTVVEHITLILRLTVHNWMVLYGTDLHILNELSKQQKEENIDERKRKFEIKPVDWFLLRWPIVGTQL